MVLTNRVFPLVPAVLLLYVREEKRSVDGSAVSEMYAPPPRAEAVQPVNVVEVTLILDGLVRLEERAPPLPELHVHALK